MKVLVKFGGSVITYKDAKNFPTRISEILSSGERFVRKDVINRIAKEISELHGIKLVVVNGAGPFGHAMVKRYIDVGDVGIKDIHRSVEYLNSIFINALKDFGVNVVTLHPYDTCFYNGSFVTDDLINKLQELTSLGYLVSTYGDVIKASVKTKYGNFQVISGDDLIVEIAKGWRPDKIIVATDVDGVFTRDPKTCSDAKLIPLINSSTMNHVEFSTSRLDVTGGMRSKVEKLIMLSNLGFQSIVVNGLKSGMIRKAILGKACGTVFLPSTSS